MTQYKDFWGRPIPDGLPPFAGFGRPSGLPQNGSVPVGRPGKPFGPKPKPDMQLSVSGKGCIVGVTSNRSQYFADLAKKFKDDAKGFREEAKKYAEQNSNVTLEYVNDVRDSLERKINTKQPQGDYALSSSIPKKLSELTNDSTYIKQTEMNAAVSSVLPEKLGKKDMFLKTDGENIKWAPVMSLSLFDIIEKDHVLTYEESKGLALLGTQVYKNATTNGFGYPDFYNKVLEEYNDASYLTTITKPFVRPNLTSDGVMGGDSFACEASSKVSWSSAYLAFDGYNIHERHCWAGNGLPAYITFYNPAPLKVTELKLQNRAVYNEVPSAGFVQASNDNVNWIDLTTFTNSIVASAAQWSIDLSGNTNFYKYYRINITETDSGVITPCIGEIDIIAQEPIIKINTNGHKFYDVADKAYFDEMYETTGEAWYYGIDKVNESIFLPRTTRSQITMVTSEVGTYQEAGLPNITGELLYAADCRASSGAFYVVATQVSSENSGGNWNSDRIGFDASRSNTIYGASDTVTPFATKKILYMVVGNTEVSESQMSSSQFDYLENQVILKANQDLSDISSNACSLIAHQAMPSNTCIDLTLGAGGTEYTAPGDGYVLFEKVANAGQNIGLLYSNNGTYGLYAHSPANGAYLSLLLPVNKNQKFKASYTASGNTLYFRFIYAVGSESEVE